MKTLFNSSHVHFILQINIYIYIFFFLIYILIKYVLFNRKCSNVWEVIIFNFKIFKWIPSSFVSYYCDWHSDVFKTLQTRVFCVTRYRDTNFGAHYPLPDVSTMYPRGHIKIFFITLLYWCDIAEIARFRFFNIPKTVSQFLTVTFR